jgi:hypothetical protein
LEDGSDKKNRPPYAIGTKLSKVCSVCRGLSIHRQGIARF